MMPKLTEFIPHAPEPKQAAFLLLPNLEAFYGGEPGGGKSDALLMAALQYVDVPSYAAILFRRTYADLALPGALMDRAYSWLSNTAARWVDKNKTWQFPSGATLSFGYLESEKDKYRYQSAEFQFVGFDEVSQFLETQYTYLFSRLRRLEGVKIPLRMRSASNPPATTDGQWVKRRFITHRAKNVPFIPAGLDDNPHVDKAGYLESLDHLDETTRAQLFDWFATVEGLVYHNFSEDNLTNEEPDGAYQIHLAIDDGYFPDPRATLWIQQTPSHILVFDELYQYKTLEEETVQDILDSQWKLPASAVVSHEAPDLTERLKRANIQAKSWLARRSTSERSTRVAAIKKTRALIKDSNNQRIIKINRRCKNLIWEITEGYRYPTGRATRADDKPEDGNDHAIQALESWIWSQYGVSTGQWAANPFANYRG